jgi:glycosyltransferase involved in cell wall biosynthesis
VKILFVTNEVPFPPDNGVRIVSHHAMRLMKEAGHELALAVLTEETDDVAMRFSHISAWCRNAMAWWMPLPARSRVSVQLSAALHEGLFFVERYRSAAFRRRLSTLIENFRPDAIHFDIITLAQYVRSAPPGVGTVASINDSNALTLENALAQGKYTGLSRIYREIQLKRVRRYEATKYAEFDAVHVMSDVDAAYLRKRNPGVNTVVISNGVDPSLFDLPDQARDYRDIIFVAKLVADNLDGLRTFLEVSWPIIAAASPDVKLHVVGKIGAEARGLNSVFAGRRNIIFHGYVERLEDVYRKCSIAIVPINKDCGIINKVIEAMAAGLAVVGFENTFAGIKEARLGQDCVTVANFADFGRAVVELLRDDSRRAAIQRAARTLAGRYYQWSTRSADYERMYRDSAERAARKQKAPREP